MGNAYLDKQRAVQQKFLDVGEEMGMQKMWDYVQLALRDPNVMGKDIIGRSRMEKIYKRLSELANDYHLAFTDHAEADYKQEKLDDGLREIWGEDLTSFYDRYPYLKKADYTKPHKKWR